MTAIDRCAPRRRQSRIMQLIFAGVAGIAMLAFVNAAHPDAVAAPFGQVRLTDTAIESPLPQSPPDLAGGGIAVDDNDDQAQLQQQLAQQQMQQSEQQAEQQNEAAEQQALQDELQGQQTEQQANNP
jgi:flagellar motor protein MotB